ncbi:MAG: hypothetical protein KY475_21820 [Planctomycetes bacterium]|nr:hypothetical protein [Planctomycetota bacterium]
MSGHASQTRTAAPTPSRKYVFAIVSLAVFCLVLGTSRPKVKGYVASTIIEFDAAGAEKAPDEGTGLPLTKLHSRLASDSLLDKTAQGVAAAGPGSEHFETLRRYVNDELQVRPGERSNQFVISLTGADRLLPVAMLNELTSHLSAVAEAPPDLRRDDEIEELADARDAAGGEVKRIQDAIRSWERRRDEHRANKPAPEIFAPRTTPAPAAPRENPEWRELAAALEQLRGRRLTLLVDRMPAHPEVQDVQLRIEEVERQLAEIPRFIPMAEPRIKAAAPADLQRQREALADYERVAAALAAEGERLQSELESAEAELAAATTAFEGAAAARQAVAAPTVRVIEEARIIGAAGGAPSGLGLLGMVVFAAIAGVFAVRRIPAGGGLGVFTSPDEIARTLGLPVIATISTGDGPAIPAAPRPGRLFPIGLRLCQAVLVAFVVMTAAGALTDSLIARLLLRSPLQAFALTCERFLPL